MPPTVNRQVVLKSRPAGIPQAENFELVDAPLPALAEGLVLVRNLYVTAEPAMRGWVSAVANYSEPVPIGGVMRSPAVGRVVESRHPDYQPGELVTGWFGWQAFAAVDAGKKRYPEALAALTEWVRAGKIRYREEMLEGLEQAPGSIAGLYRGENLGKRVIRIAPEA